VEHGLFLLGVGVTTLFGVTVDLNAAAILTFVAALIAAYPSWRLVSANRRKVLAEASTVASSAADARIEKAARLFAEDNERLRAELAGMRLEHAALEGRHDALEHRCDQLTQLLIENGITVPPIGHA
jgi:hypothetical protein